MPQEWHCCWCGLDPEGEADGKLWGNCWSCGGAAPRRIEQRGCRVAAAEPGDTGWVRQRHRTLLRGLRRSLFACSLPPLVPVKGPAGTSPCPAQSCSRWQCSATRDCTNSTSFLCKGLASVPKVHLDLGAKFWAAASENCQPGAV